MSTGEPNHFWGKIYNMSEVKIEKENNFWEKLADDNELKGVEMASDHAISKQYIDRQIGSIAFHEDNLLTFNGDSWISTSPIATISNASLPVDGVDVMATIQHLEREIEKLYEKIHEKKHEESINTMAEEMCHEIDKEIIQKIVDLSDEIDHIAAFNAAMKGV